MSTSVFAEVFNIKFAPIFFRHEERHKDGEVFSCESCNRVFKNEKNLNHHIKTHHVSKPPPAEQGSEKAPKPGKSPKKVRKKMNETYNFSSYFLTRS